MSEQAMAVRVGPNRLVEIWHEGAELTGKEWKRLAAYCALAASAVGDPYTVTAQGVRVSCESIDAMAELIERLAAKAEHDDLVNSIAESATSLTEFKDVGEVEPDALAKGARR